MSDQDLHNPNPQNAEAENTEITQAMQAFYQRADAIIELANSQLGNHAHSGQVAGSLLYAAARYSASTASIGFVKADDFVKEKQEIIDFYSRQFAQMLSDNLDDYAQNFDRYTQIGQNQGN